MPSDECPICAGDQAIRLVTLDVEHARLRSALRKIRDKHTRVSESWRSDRSYPTKYAKAWHDGFVTALAECAIVADEALDPVATAEHDDLMMVAGRGTDLDWFERTGMCGHCGNLGSECVCPPDDPCQCGPHDLRTDPVTCSRCKGEGILHPPRTWPHSPEADSAWQ